MAGSFDGRAGRHRSGVATAIGLPDSHGAHVTDTISLRQWNRTLLARQHLLDRVDDDAIEVLDRCVGLQSQDPRAAFWALWSRIEGFEPTELDELLTSREVVRMALLRSTVLLMDAEDARWVRPLAQPALDAELSRSHASTLRATTAAEVLETAAGLLAGQAIGGADLGRRLALAHPGENPSTLTAIARCGLPLVQIPPRGLWAGHGAPTYQLFDDWVGPGDPAVTGDEARRELVRLYLRGFGPATAAGIGSWAGMPGLGALLEQMESDWELICLDGPGGERLFDLEGLDVVDPDVPAPARLVAPYDHVLVAAGADRCRVADPDLFSRTVASNGRSPGFVLIDGMLAGTWRFGSDRRVQVDYLRAVTRSEQSAVDDEADRLVAFVRAAGPDN